MPTGDRYEIKIVGHDGHTYTVPTDETTHDNLVNNEGLTSQTTSAGGLTTHTVTAPLALATAVVRTNPVGA